MIGFDALIVSDDRMLLLLLLLWRSTLFTGSRLSSQWCLIVRLISTGYRWTLLLVAKLSLDKTFDSIFKRCHVETELPQEVGNEIRRARNEERRLF